MELSLNTVLTRLVGLIPRFALTNGAMGPFYMQVDWDLDINPKASGSNDIDVCTELHGVGEPAEV
jgi:hypothetical protein